MLLQVLILTLHVTTLMRVSLTMEQLPLLSMEHHRQEVKQSFGGNLTVPLSLH